MRSTTEFLEWLASAGVRVWSEQGKLLYRANKGVMTADAVEELKRHKAAILARLDSPAPIPRGAAASRLSHAQSRLWFLAQLEAASTAYNVPLHHLLDGPLNVEALSAAIDQLVERHQSLRTTFALADGEARQTVHPPRSSYLEIADAAGWDLAEARAAAQAESRLAFDLERGPLFRWKLLRLAPRRHLLLITLHHLVCDGVSVGVLSAELSELYRAQARRRPHALAPVEVHYQGFTQWQHDWLATDAAAAQREYWRSKLTAPHPVLNLPLDFPRPPHQSFEGGEVAWTLKPAQLASLRELASRHSCSLFTLLVALVKVLLFRYSGQQDIVTGSPFAGRNHPDLKNQIGFYLNMLPLRDRLSAAMSFRELLAAVRQTVNDAADHQELPFDLIVEAVGVSRELARSPLFDVAVILQSQREDGLQFDDLQATPCFDHPGTSKYDLTFCFKETAHGLVLNLEYCSALFGRRRIDRLACHFENLAASAIRDDSASLRDLELLSPAERLRLRHSNENTLRAQAGTTVLSLFEEQVQAVPDEIAIAMDDGSDALTYAALDTRSSRIAHWLRAQGVAAEDRVAVLLPRSCDLVAALLGILKAGAAYVPLDPELPPARLDLILEDAAPRLVLTPVLLASIEPGDDSPLPAPEADQLAYVIYTSGSTGRPKGVAISHRSLANVLVSLASQPGLVSSDVLLAVTTVSFDIAAVELFLPLTRGARTVLARPTVAADGEALLAALRTSHATILQATPVTWRLLIASGWDRSFPVRAWCGGEALRKDLAEQILSRAGELWNLYGPTETTIWSGATRADAVPAADPVAIGGAVAATGLHVLDANLALQPAGVPGQLYIGGDGLARGYHNNPALTAARFVPDPFSPIPGARLYATGDLVQLREDGGIAFLGRLDHQVKVRGYRIEPGEIEAALTGCPSVGECLVVPHPDASGEAGLCAYVIPRAPSRGFSLEDLRTFLSARLPEYMVPQFCQVLDTWPLTPSGKIDRRALPAPQPAPPVDAPAQTPEVEILRGLFAEVLSLPAVSPDDHFFARGGHSLLAMRLIARIRAVYRVDLPVRAIFEAPTPAGLALLLRPGRSSLEPLNVQPRPERLPLSPAQTRLWFLDRFGASAAAYNISVALRLDGDLDFGALQMALNDLVERHESLRTVFAERDGVPEQRILSPGDARLPLTVEQVPAAAIPARIQALAATPIPIAREIPIKAWLLQDAPARNVLLIVLHHIACDARSLQVLTKDLASLYADRCRGAEPSSMAPHVQYADAVLWQNRTFPFEPQIEFWSKALAGMPAELPLPTDFPRPPTATYRGGNIPLTIDRELRSGLESLARKHGATLFMVLQAGVAVFLSRLGAGGDIPVGTPIAGRSDAAMEGIAGLFVNMIVLRTDVSGNPRFGELLDRVRSFDLAAYAHQHAPFERLVEVLQPERSQSRHPLFQVALSLQHQAAGRIEVPGLTIHFEPVDSGTAKFDLTWNLETGPDGIAGSLEYSADLFAEETARSLASRFLRVLRQAVANPAGRIGDWNLLDAQECDELRRLGSGPGGAPGEASIVSRFETQVARNPDAVALVFGEESVTYDELNRRANQLAHVLIRAGAGPETCVAICLDRSFDLIVAVLAVLKAGAAYLPLDPNDPDARLRQVILDAQAVLAIGPAPLEARLGNVRCVAPGAPGMPEHNVTDEHRRCRLDANHVAYVIYTSGSTGEPKGIQIPHAGIANFTAAAVDRAAAGAGSRMLQFASITFDASILEIAMALTSGATLVLIAAAQRAPEQVAALMRAQRVTHALLPPAILTALPVPQDLPLECLLTGGEACPPETAGRWSRRYRMINAYGPTEISVCATFSDPLEGPAAPIGRPLRNTRLYVLDANLQPVPRGVAGSLYVAGAGLARGYLRRPGLTASSFLPDPLSASPGGRMYRTGDRVRYQSDGQLEFLGREDAQVKIRGYRVELAEIEAALSRHPEVLQAAVVVLPATGGDPALHGFLVPRPGTAPGIRELRQFLAQTLPGYMVPAGFSLTGALPMNASGKIDRKALARTPIAASVREIVPPRGPLDAVLLRIFREVLEREELSIDDDFFAAGGHSLSAMRIVSRIRTVFQVELPLSLFFSAGSVAQIADHLEETEIVPGRAAKVAEAYERLRSLTPEQRSQLLEARRARSSGA